jgi:hypothetical protein
MDYLEGSQYSPHMRILVWDATWFSVPAKVYLEIYLAGRALIVYRFASTRRSSKRWPRC